MFGCKRSSKAALNTEEVIRYIKGITPLESDVPDYFFKLMQEVDRFRLEEVDIRDLMESDADFKEYIMSGEIRYEDDELDFEDLSLPIVVFKGQVMDGYSRSSRNWQNQEFIVNAYIA